jgi:hypothetical protein
MFFVVKAGTDLAKLKSRTGKCFLKHFRDAPYLINIMRCEQATPERRQT